MQYISDPLPPPPEKFSGSAHDLNSIKLRIGWGCAIQMLFLSLCLIYFKQDITAYQPLSPSENVKNSAVYRGCEVTAFIPFLDVLEH